MGENRQSRGEGQAQELLEALQADGADASGQVGIEQPILEEREDRLERLFALAQGDGQLDEVAEPPARLTRQGEEGKQLPGGGVQSRPAGGR